MIQPRPLRFRKLARKSRIGRTKIYDAINEGLLRAKKLGRKTLILRSDLLQFLEALPSMTAAVEPGAGS